jgi:hypothetical protein
VSHLLFAYDKLLFCEPSVEQFRNLRCLLLCFEVVLGMKINLSKSEIVLVSDVEGLASILGCSVPSLLTKCLGLPLVSHYKASTIWSSIIEKMENRFGGLKRLYLSKGGRLTLIKSSLSNLPTYYLSIPYIPLGVAN